MKPATDQHLYPFTIAFKAGLDSGQITLDNALECINRLHDAYLEAVVQQGGRHAFVLKGIDPQIKTERARRAD
jgi:hypothetical protein